MLLVALVFLQTTVAAFLKIPGVDGVDRFYALDTCLMDSTLDDVWYRYEDYNSTHYKEIRYLSRRRCKSREMASETYGPKSIYSSIPEDKYAFCMVYKYDAECTEDMELPVRCYHEKVCISDPSGGSIYFTKTSDDTVESRRYGDAKCTEEIDERTELKNACEFTMSPITGYVEYRITNGIKAVPTLLAMIVISILLNYLLFDF